MDSSSSSKQSRLLGRLLGKLRGEHRYTTLDKSVSYSSTGLIGSVGCGSSYGDEEAEAAPRPGASSVPMDHATFATNIDMRYSGQYLTPEQLPEFCNQLEHLVEVIRNIQSYARVTGEYPRELERRLEREACEVAALAGEARKAHEVAERTRLQRRALKAQRTELAAHVAKLRETEVRELESSVRISDRKLFKNWETVKESTDPAAYDSFLEEIRNKQTALECLVRLVEGRRAQLSRSAAPHPLPPPPHDDDEAQVTFSSRKRHDNRRLSSKRKRAAREARSVPLSNQPSVHETAQPQQVTLYISGGSAAADSSPRARAARVLPSLELPRGSVRDILFFTTN